MQTSTRRSAAEDSFDFGRGKLSDADRAKSGAFETDLLPLLVDIRLAELPETDHYRRAIEQAADRITEWAPKGVHFGWERSFKNKGKFPSTMTKAAARSLVAGLLRNARLTISLNRPDEKASAEQLRVVANADGIVGTRGQRRVRVVLIRDSAGFLVGNAFPVHAR